MAVGRPRTGSFLTALLIELRGFSDTCTDAELVGQQSHVEGVTLVPPTLFRYPTNLDMFKPRSSALSDQGRSLCL